MSFLFGGGKGSYEQPPPVKDEPRPSPPPTAERGDAEVEDARRRRLRLSRRDTGGRKTLLATGEDRYEGGSRARLLGE